MSYKKLKIGVIGAGAAGLSAIKNCLDFDCDVVCFEQSDKIGGTWNFSDEVAKDKNGLEVHSSMYKGLITNTPKEIMSFPGYPFDTPEHSFVQSSDVLNYFNKFADTFDLRQYITFECQVVSVRPLLNETWEIYVRDLRTEKCQVFTFDAVLVCVGFSVPFTPILPGCETFRGQQTHSHYYRTAEVYRDEKVLIVGGGPSGIDLTLAIGKVAKRVFWSHIEKFELAMTLPDAVCKKPGLVKLTASGAEFTDGSLEEFSIIIYATGFEYSYPFLSIDCGLSSEEKFIGPLYKHCLNINRPSLGLIGLTAFALAMPTFDLQVRFCLTFMTQRKHLPTREDMLKDTENKMNELFKTLPRNKAHFLGIERHEQYYADLAATAGIQPINPVIIKIFNKSFLDNFFKSFDTFRDFNYSIVDDDNFTSYCQPQTSDK